MPGHSLGYSHSPNAEISPPRDAEQHACKNTSRNMIGRTRNVAAVDECNCKAEKVEVTWTLVPKRRCKLRVQWDEFLV